ncbi:hypothetical protein BC835DRAFT_1256346, partial [Cytidiella melzeri]
LICLVNVQHDCANAQCTSTFLRSTQQECCNTGRKTVQVGVHSKQPLFLLNTRSVHNYQYIADVLPAALK